MFNGIIEEVGEVVALEQSADVIRLTLNAPLVVQGAKHGDSISVNGVCLTVVDQSTLGFTVDVMQQTLDMSTIGGLQPGERVNLERAALVGDRLGGHIVQGHVDGTAEVLSVSPGEAWSVVRFSLSDELAPLVVDQGSIAVAGVSLTVSDVDGGHGHPATDGAGSGSADGSGTTAAAADPTASLTGARGGHWFEVSLIPETLSATILGTLVVGDVVNIETDILARHVARLMSFTSASGAPAAAQPPSATGRRSN